MKAILNDKCYVCQKELSAVLVDYSEEGKLNHYWDVKCNHCNNYKRYCVYIDDIDIKTITGDNLSNPTVGTEELTVKCIMGDCFGNSDGECRHINPMFINRECVSFKNDELCFDMSRLELINRYFFQWLFVRLAKSTIKYKDKTHWRIIGFIIPTTGWKNNYRYVLKRFVFPSLKN